MEPVRYKDGAERWEGVKHLWQCSGAGPTWWPLTQTEGFWLRWAFAWCTPSESHLWLNSILEWESGGCWICRRLHRVLLSWGAQLRTAVPLVPVHEQNCWRAAAGEEQHESKGEISKCKQTKITFTLKNYPSAKCSNNQYNCNLPRSLSKRGSTSAVGVGFPSLKYAIAREPSNMKENVFRILRQSEVYFQTKQRKMTLI